jgi:hemerythrin
MWELAMPTTATTPFPWKTEYSVGVPSIDGQHRRVVFVLGELHQAMAQGKSNDIVGSILASLVSYAKADFADEERLLARHGCSELTAHVQEHRDFIGQVNEFYQKWKAGR